jgi:hypothetical protein
MTIRNYKPGDEVAQVSIYNEAAADLPRFKPATVDEVRRRCRAAEFDAGTRFYALEQERGKPVAYATFQANGRVSLPWCRKGHEHWAEPLLDRVLEALRGRGMTQAFAAYRGDWTLPRDFFLGHDFSQTRTVHNFILDLVEMPTPPARTASTITPVTAEDLPAVAAMGTGILRVGPPELEQALLHNPFFGRESLFALRGRDGKPVAVAVLVTNPAYAAPKQLDAKMPCFRLGAFGTEGLTTKRVNGLFSFLVAEPREVSRTGLDLLGHSAYLLQETEVETFAAQVLSDVPHLMRFYQQYFRAQGDFPLYERSL